jgi:hypothetical protein
MSDQKPTIHESLAKVMASVSSVAKKDKNTSQGFNFRGIDAVLNAVAPALREHGVIVMPKVTWHDYKTVEVGQKRTQMAHVIVSVQYTFTGQAGDSIECQVLGEAMDSGDKAVAKAMSVAFRIALLQALALPTDEPDPDSYSYERSEAKPEATIEQVEEWKMRIADAVDGKVLEFIRQELTNFGFTDELRNDLASVYTTRLRDLQTPKVTQTQ